MREEMNQADRFRCHCLSHCNVGKGGAAFGSPLPAIEFPTLAASRRLGPPN